MGSIQKEKMINFPFECVCLCVCVQCTPSTKTIYTDSGRKRHYCLRQNRNRNKHGKSSQTAINISKVQRNDFHDLHWSASNNENEKQQTNAFMFTQTPSTSILSHAINIWHGNSKSKRDAGIFHLDLLVFITVDVLSRV